MKHTQGKWSVRGYNIITESGGERIRVASVDLRKGMKPPKFTEVRANANLISNAPEMLEMLKELCYKWIERGDGGQKLLIDDNSINQKLLHLIAKAEGK